MTNPSVCILVLNWRGADDTLACLESLSKLSYEQATTVVIDNGSGDDSVQRIRTGFPQIQIIELPENLMFGGGNNVGLDWASKKGYDYTIFLNNDTLVQPDFVQPLLKAFQSDPTLGIAGPLICYAEPPEVVWYGGGQVNLWTGNIAHRHIRNRVSSVVNRTASTDYVTGCCLMMPTKLAKQMGGFNPAFTMYGEDVDLSLRCRKAGYKLVFVPWSKIYHKVSASVGGEFGLSKMWRKSLGLMRLFQRHATWYQWFTIVISQVVMIPKYVYTYIAQRSKHVTQG